MLQLALRPLELLGQVRQALGELARRIHRRARVQRLALVDVLDRLHAQPQLVPHLLCVREQFGAHAAYKVLESAAALRQSIALQCGLLPLGLQLELESCRCRVRGRRKLDRARELLLLLAALSQLELEGDEL